MELYSEENSPVDKTIYKANSVYNNKYYRIYYGEDVIQQTIDVK